MSYNNVGMLSTKGSALSGFIEKSRVTGDQAIRMKPSAAEAVDQESLVNPLEARRPKHENQKLRILLDEHNERRKVKVDLAEYEERRLAEGVSKTVVKEELAIRRANLMAKYELERDERERQRRQGRHPTEPPQKLHSAKAFSEAVGLEGRIDVGEGHAFNKLLKSELRQENFERWKQHKEEEVERKFEKKTRTES